VFAKNERGYRLTSKNIGWKAPPSPPDQLYQTKIARGGQRVHGNCCESTCHSINGN